MAQTGQNGKLFPFGQTAWAGDPQDGDQQHEPLVGHHRAMLEKKEHDLFLGILQNELLWRHDAQDSTGDAKEMDGFGDCKFWRPRYNRLPL